MYTEEIVNNKLLADVEIPLRENVSGDESEVCFKENWVLQETQQSVTRPLGWWKYKYYLAV